MTSTAPGTAPLPELVVRWLGRIALTGLVAGAALIYLAVRQTGPTDPAITGVIGTFLAIVTGSTGALGAILASTRAMDPGPAGSVTVTPSPATDTTPSAGVTVTAATAETVTGRLTAPARKRTARKRAHTTRA